jgi:hypothetical protein
MNGIARAVPEPAKTRVPGVEAPGELHDSASGAAASDRRGRSPLRVALAVTWVGLAAGATWAGWEYYLTPRAARPFAAGHELYAPAGLIGHSFGIAGAAMMAIGVGLYMARKRVRFLAGWGRMSTWLDVHIFLCTLGPFLVVLHTSFRVGGLVAIAFWSMVLVVGSGVFGRFLYGHIPKTTQGRVRTLAALEQSRAGLEQMLRQAGIALGPAVSGARGGVRPGLLTAVIDAVRFDLTRNRRMAATRARLARLSVPPESRERLVALLLDEERVRHQINWLKPFQRLFHYWHVFHLPLALVMLLVLAIHIGVAIAFGYGWPG